MRAPDHGRPYDYPRSDEAGRRIKRAHQPPPDVYPSDVEPSVALFGPKGEPLLWKARRPVGFRREAIR